MNTLKNKQTVADCIKEKISLLILTVFFKKAVILPSFIVQALELCHGSKK